MLDMLIYYKLKISVAKYIKSGNNLWYKTLFY